MAGFDLKDDQDIEEDLTFPGSGSGKSTSGSKAASTVGPGYTFNAGATQDNQPSAGYTINPAKHSGQAGFKIKTSDDEPKKSKSFMRKHWLKALLMLPLAYYAAEGVYYTSQTDHPDQYALAGIPGYVIEEIGYDLEDAFHYASGFVIEEQPAPEIPAGSNYVPQWMVQEELKVLFLRPNYSDENFNQVMPTLDYQAFYDFQQQYVLDAIADGKGTKMGNAAAHEEYMTIYLASPGEIMREFSHQQRRELENLPHEEQLEMLMGGARSLMERTQSRDYLEQRNPSRQNYTSFYKPAY